MFFDDYKKDYVDFSCLEYIILAVFGFGLFLVVSYILAYFSLFNIFTLIAGFIISFAIVFLFSDLISVFFNLRSFIIVGIIAILCFTFPILMFFQYQDNLTKYENDLAIYEDNLKKSLSSYPTESTVEVQIDCSRSYVDSGGSVGSDWSEEHKINNKTFHSGDIVKISSTEPFTITTILTEHDAIDDVGIGTTEEYRYTDPKLYKGKYTIRQKITVNEDGGRKNSGAYATYEIEYILTRTNTKPFSPERLTSEEILFYDNEHNIENIFWGECICLSVLIIIPLFGLIKVYSIKQKNEAQKKQKLKQKNIPKQETLEKEHFKQAKIENEELQNISEDEKIRELINIPLYYKMVNGLPVDNNNQLYGSLTVYIGENGKHFHSKKGCCSANKPVHLYRALEKYTPCSKCTPPHLAIPQWFKDYEELMKKNKKE